MANLVTGIRGEDHITAEDVGAFNAGVVTDKRYVLNTGKKFETEIISNNLVRIFDGDLIDQGRHIRIDTGNYEDVEIVNGVANLKRNDLIVMRYVKDKITLHEYAEIAVITGESDYTAKDPDYTVGNIMNGDYVDEFPLYRIRLNGLSIYSIEKLYTVLDSIEEIYSLSRYTNQELYLLGDKVRNEVTERENLAKRVKKNESDISEFAKQTIPEEYLEAAVDEYVNNHSGGFATEAEVENLKFSDIAGGENFWPFGDFDVQEEGYVLNMQPYKLPSGTYCISFISEIDFTLNFYDANREYLYGMNIQADSLRQINLDKKITKDCEYVSLVAKGTGKIKEFDINDGSWTRYTYKSYIPSVKMLAKETEQVSKSVAQLEDTTEHINNELQSNIALSDHDTSTDGINITDAEDGEMLVTEFTKNILNPTLETTTLNGVTCKANGDGTYTFNGTAGEGNAYFVLGNVDVIKGVTYRTIGCPTGGAYNKYFIYLNIPSTGYEIGSGINWICSENKTVTLRLCIYAGFTVSNMVLKPMLTTDLNATYDDFVQYGGYEVRSCGKNILNPTLETNTHNGITFTRNNDRTYSISGSRTDTSKGAYTSIIENIPLEKGVYKLTGAIDENTDIRCILKKPSGTINLYDEGNGIILNVDETGITITLMIVTKKDTSETLIVKPMITTDLSATYEDFEPYSGESIQVTNDTESPVLGLRSHKGLTHIISPGNVKAVYPRNKSGKGVMEVLYNKSKRLDELENDLGGLKFEVDGSALKITDGTNTWSLTS